MATASAFNKEFRLFVDKLGPEVSKSLARMAREGEANILRDQASRRGIEPGHIEAVDGVQGKPFEAVRPDGIIVALFDYRREIVATCFEELIARSPVVSGDYRNSHFCQLDGKGLGPLVVPTQEQLKGITKITITNPQPYSRKLEVGLTEGGAPFVKQVDPHIFESAASAVAREWGASAIIKFSYVDLEGAYVPIAARLARRRRFAGERIAKSKMRAVRYPCINIYQA